MDKKVLYALIGGAALIGAAVAYHLATASEGDGIDDDLDSLGPLELEEGTGMMKFEYYLKVLQICTFYGKGQFKDKKKDYVARRRQALKAGDDKQYEMIAMQMTQEEEMMVQTKLMEVMEKIGMNEQEFQRNAMYHSQDQMKSI